MLKKDDAVRYGSAVDIDTWVDAQDFDILDNGLQRLREAHQLTNQVFFGLLRDDFLATLKPEYT
jgi:hypothetical protein